MNLLLGRFPFDGEMAGSGAAMDPLFWVAHGSVERLMQRVLFANMTSDTKYSSMDDHCSGHSATGTKAWLKGFYLLDESIETQKLTNTDFAAILNPTTDEYRDLVNFVYDVTDFSWCDGSDAWFTAE